MFLLCSLFNIQHCSTRALRSVSNMLVSSANLWTTGNITMPFGIYHWDTSYIMHRAKRDCIKGEDLRCTWAPATWPFLPARWTNKKNLPWGKGCIPDVHRIFSVSLWFKSTQHETVSTLEPVHSLICFELVITSKDDNQTWPVIETAGSRVAAIGIPGCNAPAIGIWGCRSAAIGIAVAIAAIGTSGCPEASWI
jgi:hypothetical protein